MNGNYDWDPTDSKVVFLYRDIARETATLTQELRLSGDGLLTKERCYALSEACKSMLTKWQVMLINCSEEAPTIFREMQRVFYRYKTIISCGLDLRKKTEETSHYWETLAYFYQILCVCIALTDSPEAETWVKEALRNYREDSKCAAGSLLPITFYHRVMLLWRVGGPRGRQEAVLLRKKVMETTREAAEKAAKEAARSPSEGHAPLKFNLADSAGAITDLVLAWYSDIPMAPGQYLL